MFAKFENQLWILHKITEKKDQRVQVYLYQLVEVDHLSA